MGDRKPLTLAERRRWRRWFIRTCRVFGCSWQTTFATAAMWEEMLDKIGTPEQEEVPRGS